MTFRFSVTFFFVCSHAEIKMMKELHHPHVVQFLGFTNIPSINKLFIVMEYMPLGSVEDYLSQHPKTTLATRVRWCSHMARALAYLHNRKPNFLIHRTFIFIRLIIILQFKVVNGIRRPH